MSATTDSTAAILLEPIQGEGGVNIPSEDYLRKVRAWCDKQGLLLILDEVQTGLGRLGSLFGYQEYDVEPDVITLAKGLGGGVPIGAFLSKNHCMALEPGDHGSTFGGNPLTTAAAYASTSFIIRHDIPGNAKVMGERLIRNLEELKSTNAAISEVRGRGLLVAVEFENNIASDVLSLSNQAGVLLNMVKPNTLRLMPPLTISSDEVDEGVTRLEQALNRL